MSSTKSGVTKLRNAARDSERLADAVEIDLPCACVFTNATPEMQKLLTPAYAARTALPEAIDLVRLPAVKLRGDNFHVTIDDVLIEEQIVPYERAHPPSGAPLPKRGEIALDTVLIARYGDGTWGHWMGELLPMAVMVERHRPGWFVYAMPARIVDPVPGDVLALRVREAFAAYGIGPERFVALQRDTEYVTTNLQCLTPVWTDHCFHPAAVAALRSLPIGREREDKVALIRHDTRRAITNADEVFAVLLNAGFYAVDPASLSFNQQVAVFRSAPIVFSVLGSTLSGLLYAPDKVCVVAAVPETFGDGFFYNMIQHRRGSYTEIRGPFRCETTSPTRDSAFEVDCNLLRSILDAASVEGYQADFEQAIMSSNDPAIKALVPRRLDMAPASAISVEEARQTRMPDQPMIQVADAECAASGKGTLWVPDHAGEHYLTVLGRLHECLNPNSYLEIGCDTGRSLSLAHCASLAIDPHPKVTVDDAIGVKSLCAFYRMTSDAFFARHDPSVILGAPVDMAFLDGMHLCEYLLRDFLNTERYCRRNSVIVLHDCLPVEWPMAERRHARMPIRPHHVNSWTGDVWRTALLLKRRRPDLSITAYAAPPSGLLCVTNLSPTSTMLADSYVECVREMMSYSLQDIGIENVFRALNVEPTSILADGIAISARFWL